MIIQVDEARLRRGVGIGGHVVKVLEAAQARQGVAEVAEGHDDARLDGRDHVVHLVVRHEDVVVVGHAQVEIEDGPPVRAVFEHRRRAAAAESDRGIGKLGGRAGGRVLVDGGRHLAHRQVAARRAVAATAARDGGRPVGGLGRRAVAAGGLQRRLTTGHRLRPDAGRAGKHGQRQRESERGHGNRPGHRGVAKPEPYRVAGFPEHCPAVGHFFPVRSRRQGSARRLVFKGGEMEIHGVWQVGAGQALQTGRPRVRARFFSENRAGCNAKSAPAGPALPPARGDPLEGPFLSRHWRA